MEEFAPAAPVDELGQDVGASQPDEAGLRVSAAQGAHRVERVARARQQLGRVDADARMMADDLAGAGDARGERLHAIAGLQRVLRRDQPDHLVQLQASQRRLGDVGVALVRRVEAAAEQPHAHAGLQVEPQPLRGGPAGLRDESGRSREPHI